MKYTALYCAALHCTALHCTAPIEEALSAIPVAARSLQKPPWEDLGITVLMIMAKKMIMKMTKFTGHF